MDSSPSYRAMQADNTKQSELLYAVGKCKELQEKPKEAPDEGGGGGHKFQAYCNKLKHLTFR